MSTDQLLSELKTGLLVQRDMLVWRSGMGDWAPIAGIEELRSAAPVVDVPAPRPLPPPPAPLPPRLGSNVNASPSPLSVGPASIARAPLPPPPSVPFAMPKPPYTPVPDVPPPASVMPLKSSPYASPPGRTPDLPSGLPALNSAFGSSGSSSLPLTAGVPAPVVARINTPRPVAVDFSEMEPRRSTPMRIIIGSGIAALAMIAGTVYGLSAGGVFESSPSVAAEHGAPASAASKPVSAPAPVAVKPSAPPPAAAPSSEPASNEPQTQTVSAKEDEPVAVTPAVAAEPEEKAEEKSSKAKSKEKDEEQAEVSSAGHEEASESRSERRQAGRRMKRSSSSSSSSSSEEKEKEKESAAETRKAEPRRSKARAVVASTEEPRAEDADPAKDTAGSTFNKQAAMSALDDAAAKAKNCRPQGGPSGTGRVQVRYEPNGKVGAVSILTPSFANTTTGDCVVMVFRRANVPAFTGAPAVVLNKNFDIPAN
jgi:hypothetical protein